MNNIKT